MDKQVVFKTSLFGGFEKKAVLDYIYQLNESAETAQARLDEQLSEIGKSKEALEANLQEIKGKLDQVNQNYDSVITELSGERERVDQMTHMIEGLNAEIESQAALIHRKEAEIEEYARKNAKLSQEKAALEANRLEIEYASAQIGKLLIDAHTDADNILGESRQKAEALLAQANQEAGEIVAKATQDAAAKMTQADEYVARVTVEAKRSVDSALQQFALFRDQLGQTQQTILDSLGAMQTQAQTITESIDSTQETLQQAYEAAGTQEEAEAPALHTDAYSTASDDSHASDGDTTDESEYYKLHYSPSYPQEETEDFSFQSAFTTPEPGEDKVYTYSGDPVQEYTVPFSSISGNEAEEEYTPYFTPVAASEDQEISIDLTASDKDRDDDTDFFRFAAEN